MNLTLILVRLQRLADAFREEADHAMTKEQPQTARECRLRAQTVEQVIEMLEDSEAVA